MTPRTCECAFLICVHPQESVASLGPYDVILADPPYGKREKGSGVSNMSVIEEAVVTLMLLGASNSILKVSC